MRQATLQPLHRELQPPRQCKRRGCKTWLTSANEDEVCAEHGGWTAQRDKEERLQERLAESVRELIAA